MNSPLRHALAIFLLPFNAVVVIPAILLTLWNPDTAAPFPLVAVGTLVVIGGIALLSWTIWLFARIGRGTLAPWAPTSHLVVAGPYRHTRNPMITAVAAIVLGETLLFNSPALLGWLLFFVVGNHAWFLLHEEPVLRKKFRDEYKEYAAHVPRWMPRLTPWNLEHAHVGDSDALVAERFDREIVRSERARSLALAIFFTGAGFYFAIIGGVRPAVIIEVFGDSSARFWLSGIFAVGAVFEWLLVSRLSLLIRGGKTLSAMEKYGVALVETSFPTAYIIMAANFFPAPYAILAPPAFLYFFFIILSALRLDPRLCFFTGAVAAFEYLAVTIYFIGMRSWPELATQMTHPLHHAGKTIILLVCGVAMGLVTAEARRRMAEAFRMVAERDRVVDLFGRHVSSSVVESLLAQGAATRTEIRHVCVMFVDIRGFTSFAEKRTPEEVVAYLNDVYALIIEAVDRHGGIVNKFLGDGCLAVFGAPVSDGRDARNGAAAAIDLAASVESASAEGRIPATRIGVGLHAGPVVAGSVGSARRKEYTIVGDVVNVASRIEQLTKDHGVAVLASEEVWREVSGEFDGAMMGELPIRGRAEPVRVYALRGLT